MNEKIKEIRKEVYLNSTKYSQIVIDWSKELQVLYFEEIIPKSIRYEFARIDNFSEMIDKAPLKTTFSFQERVRLVEMQNNISNVLKVIDKKKIDDKYILNKMSNVIMETLNYLAGIPLKEEGLDYKLNLTDEEAKIFLKVVQTELEDIRKFIRDIQQNVDNDKTGNCKKLQEECKIEEAVLLKFIHGEDLASGFARYVYDLDCKG